VEADTGQPGIYVYTLCAAADAALRVGAPAFNDGAVENRFQLHRKVWCVGGVMNVLWIVLLGLFISLEKVTSLGRQIAPLAGIILIAAGAWLLLVISGA
jgi:hypothetical protein